MTIAFEQLDVNTKVEEQKKEETTTNKPYIKKPFDLDSFTMSILILEKDIQQLKCQIEVLTVGQHLIQVKLIKINHMCKTISQVFFGRKKENDKDNF